MIDIHTHLLFAVDDGSRSLQESLKYLNQVKKIGMKDVVVTPHAKNGNNLDKIYENFNALKNHASKMGINLYLGNEIMYTASMLDYLNDKKILSLNNTKYILVEFKRYEDMPFESIITIFENIISKGYKPILCHPELYINYMDISYVKKLKELGVLMQIDSTSILKRSGLKVYHYTKKLLKDYLVDVVASDTHCTKKRDILSLSKAYKKIAKMDIEYADIIFHTNPKIIINI